MERELQTMRMAFEGAEDLRRAVAGGDLRATQLNAGRLCGSMLHAAVGDVMFSTGKFDGDVRVRGVMHPDRVTLGLILDDNASVSQWAFKAEAGDLFVFPVGGEQEGRFVGSSFYAAISVEPDQLRQLNDCEGSPSEDRYWEQPRRCRAPAAIRRAMCESIAAVAERLEQSNLALTDRRLDLFARSLTDLFLAGVALDGGEPDRRTALPGARIVRDAEDWADGRDPAAIHVSDLALALRVPRRTLERAFHEMLGVGPAHYLRTRRLAAVRAILRNADPQTTRVTDVALDHGFWELGRFAVEYRRAYGEKPSETLQKVRQAAA